MTKTDYEKIDKVITRYFSYLPLGTNFSDSVHDFKFEYKEQLGILKFLVDESILINWGEHGKHILSPKGEEIIKIHGGIEKYFENKKKENEEIIRIKNIKNEKLINDAKISKWQVKTFWYVFIFGLIGGVYAVYSIINSVLGESEEQKIERILEKKLQEQDKKHKASTYQLQPDSLSSETIDDK